MDWKQKIKAILSAEKKIFKSQDSKYFIKTAFKLTLVPVAAFSFMFYSLWTVIEMNYNFFVANGFARGAFFKEAFVDKVMMNITDYFIYFGFTIIGVFLFGLGIAYFALRPFKEIEDFAKDSIEDDEIDFEMDSIKEKKPIYQGAKLLFDYLYLVRNKIKGEKLIIPRQLLKMKMPKIDKVFLMQYTLLLTIVCIVTNILLFTFTKEIYDEIVKAGLTLLNGNKVVAGFMLQQEGTINNIYTLSMIINVVLYLSLSKNLIKAVDGVSYAFCRDIVAIVKGDRDQRLFPRYTDPGKEAALAINNYLDHTFGPSNSLPAPDRVYDEMDLCLDEQENILKLKSGTFSNIEDLPPSFIFKKIGESTSGGTYNIITPKGYTLEKLDEQQVLKFIREIESIQDVTHFKKSA